MSAFTLRRKCLVRSRTIGNRETGEVSAPAILPLHGLSSPACEG